MEEKILDLLMRDTVQVAIKPGFKNRESLRGLAKDLVSFFEAEFQKIPCCGHNCCCNRHPHQ